MNWRRENAKIGTLAVRRRLESMLPWKCANCGIEKLPTVHQKRHKYCSYQCVGKVYKEQLIGESNPNYRPHREKFCINCGASFRGNKGRKYCSTLCYQNSDRTLRKASARMSMLKYGAKKDANHKEIMNVLRIYCPTYDLSNAGCGIPDGIAWIKEAWHFFDIKNPKTGYGRKGLNDIQKKWISKWQGGPVYLIYTELEAEMFAKGNFTDLKKVDSGWTSRFINHEK